MKLQAEKALLAGLEPSEREFIRAEFAKLDSRPDQRRSIADIIAKNIDAGLPHDEYIISEIDKLDIPKQDKDALAKMIRDQLRRTEETEAGVLAEIDEEIRLIKEQQRNAR